MKKIYKLILLFALLCCGTTVKAAAAYYVVDGIRYYASSTSTKNVLVTALSSGKYSGDIVVPGSFVYNSYTYTVTGIKENAFDGCTALTSVTIEEGPTTLEMYSFYNCSALKTVSLPATLTSATYYAFYGCAALESVTFAGSTPPSTFYASGSWPTFYNCPNLSAIYVPADAVETYKTAWAGSTLADLVQTESVSSCAKPTNVIATQNTPVKATLSWTKAEGQDNYQYLYVEKNGTPNWESVEAQNTNSVELDGLTSGVEYDFYVRTYCDSEDQSEAVKKTFSVTCPAPTFPTTPVTDLSASGATVTWNAVDGISKYQYLCVVKDADTTGLWAAVEAKEGLSAELTSLTAKTHYDFYVRSWYSATSISDAVKTTFRTECAAVNAPITWDFKGETSNTVPGCWDNSGSTSTNSASNYYYVWGVYDEMLRMCNYYVQPSAGSIALINTPSVVMPASPEMELTFDYTHNSNAGDFTVKISKDAGANWTELATYAKGSGSSYTDPGTLTPVSISLADYAGETIILQFYAPANYGSGAIFVDNISIKERPACAKPSDVKATSVDSTSATITWTNGGDETSWKLQYSTDKTNWTAANEGNAFTTKPFELTGLSASTTYYVQVAAVCSESDESEWSVAGEFTTDCNAIDKLNEAFSSSLPDCWKTNAWAPSSSQRVSLSYSMSFSAYYATTEEYGDLITPFIKLGNQESDLTFQLWNYSSTTVVGELYIVVGSTTTKLLDFSATSGWVKQTIDLTEYAGETAKFIFRAHGNGGAAYSYVYIDDVVITVKPCAKPTGLAAVKGNATADISWIDESASEWNLRYRIVAEPENEWTLVNGLTAKPHTLESLLNGNEYEVQVQAACSETRTSDWTASVKFTPEACPTVAEVTLGAKTYNSVVVNWATSSASNCDVRYSTDNGENWTVAEENIAATTYTLSGLSIGATYTVAVKPSCGDDEAWVAAETFTPVYTEPEIAAASSITDAGATVSWGAVSDADVYEVALTLRKVAVSEWKATTKTDTTFSNLAAATEYDFFVRAKYADDGVSAYDSIGFATITLAPQNLQQDGESTTTSATFTWEANGAATQYQWSIDNTNWSAAQTALTATVEGLNPGSTYTFYVRSYYSESVQSAATSLSFDTQCATETLPFEQHFNSTSKPNCWTSDNWGASANNWSIDQYTDHTGESSYAASYYAKTYTANSAALVTPKVELSDAAILEFYYQNRYTSYSSSSAVNFDVVILDASDDSELRTKNYTEPSANNAWASDTLDLSAFVGKTIKVKFVGKGVGTYYTAYLKLDDVTITVKPCATPTELAAAASRGSAVVTWKDDEADTWNLRYKKTADVDWEYVNNLAVKRHTLNSLDEETEYEVQVQAVCSTTRSSEWTESVNFTPACPTPGEIQFSNKTYNGVIVSWTAGGAETAWNLKYNPGTGWTPVTENPLTTPSYTFDDLETGMTYSFTVQAACEGNWTDTVYYTPQYSAPASANVTDATDVTATATWDTVADAPDGYEYIVVARDAAEDWTSPTAVNETSATLTDLNAATEYDFYVRAVYGLNQGAATKAQFATVTIAPQNLQQDGDATTNSASFKWEANGAATQYQWSLDNSTWSEAQSELTATVDGLTAGTSYTFYVRSYYAEEKVSSPISIPFSTECDVKALGWGEDFNGNTSIPTCWEGDSHWLIASGVGVGSTNALRFNSSDTSDIQIPATALTEEAVLRFSHNNYFVTGAIYVNSIAEENQLATIEKTNYNSWKSEEISLAEYTGQTITLIFRGNKYGNYSYLNIDNVSVIAKPCPVISTLNADAKLDSVVLTWESDADAFEYCVVPQGNEATGWQDTTATTVTVKGLTPETTYTAYVRSSCSDTKKGEPKSVNFTPACPAPTALDTVDGTLATTSVSLHWTAAAGITKYQYKLGTEEWSSENVVEGTSVELTGLNPATTYTFYVRSYYNADAQSTAITKSFTTECEAVALPLNEDFSGALTCWTLVDCHNNTGVTGGAFRFYYSTTPPQYLISPELVPSEKKAKIAFQYKAENSSWEESFQVGYSTTTNETTAFTWSDTTFCSVTEYQDYSWTVPTSIKYVAIKYTANDKDYLWIDNFSVAEYVPTAIDLVGTGADDKKAIKLIENDQLVIIRDGIKYNAQGKRLGE